MQSPVSYFFSEFRYRSQTIWFKHALYFVLLIYSFYWLLHYDLLFGSHSIVYSLRTSPQGVKDLAFQLYNSPSEYLGACYIVGVAVLSILALLLKRVYFVFDIIIWFLVLNIHNKIYPTLTGGNFLLNQFLLFNCFLSFKFEKGAGFFSSIKVYLHNFSVLAIMLQLCVAYFLSALAKLGDDSWIAGTAIARVVMIDHFSPGSGLDFNFKYTIIYSLLSYLVLAYQLFFPILVWLKPIKKPFLLFGILMHLYISLVMGLLMFGLIMIIGYIYFWPVKRTYPQ